MLSYQHAYHAGCLADVHKHAAMLMILRALMPLAPRLVYVDTHSGRGLYRLDSVEAKKTGEAKAGIMRLLAERRLPRTLAYSEALHHVRKRYGEAAYPGSPLLAQMTLRPDDRMHCFELHPAEHAALSRHLKGRNLRIYKQDGYAGLARLAREKTPPHVMVVMDPSFEVKGEYLQAAEEVSRLLARWPQAVVLLWYPLLKAGHHDAMVEMLRQQDLPGFWHQEVEFYARDAVRGMYGSGLVGVNMPATVSAELAMLPPLFPLQDPPLPAPRNTARPDSSPARRSGRKTPTGKHPRPNTPSRRKK